MQEPHSIRLDVERLTALLRAHPAAAVANTPAADVANNHAAAVANTPAAAVVANTTEDCLNIVFNNYRWLAFPLYVLLSHFMYR
jgi:hypothetical protein